MRQAESEVAFKKSGVAILGMAELKEIVEFLDEKLRTREIPDYPGAHNGLQMQNEGRVLKVAAAVDASLSVIERAVAEEVDLLVVHHGLFWQGVQMLTGATYCKTKMALANGLAIYSSHIPLDVHSELGNNALLAKAIGLEIEGLFLDWKGIELGVQGVWRGQREELMEKLAGTTGALKESPGFQDRIGRVGIITGGAGSEVAAVKAAGIDTFITGEGPHWSFPFADEIGLNVVHAGHYQTETFGVKAVSAALKERFGVEAVFIDEPTGL